MKTIEFNRASAEDQRLADLVEEIMARVQLGETCDVDQYIVQYPEYADRLRGWIGTMTAMADLGHSLSVGTANRRASGSGSKIDADSPQVREPAAGILGDFRILCELGRGGMGVVYEAEQISLGRHVALKVLPFAAMLDKQQLARFKNEARAAATLDHPNIVAIHSVGAERGVHYYAMQLIEGRSLAEIIAELKPGRPPSHDETAPAAALINHATAADTAKAALPTVRAAGGAAFSTIPPFESREYYRTIARLGIQTAEALDHAHQNGILHRDIKPANLLLDDDGKLWITDFGLARIEQDAGMTMTGDLLGTLRYMSPEQALAKRVVVDHRSDIYSLGVTLYELLALRPAYPATDRQELLRQIAFEEPAPIRKLGRSIPTELDTIIGKAITKNPEERYQSANALANDLRVFLEDRPIKAKPPSVWSRTSKWSRRHRGLMAATAVILVLLTIGSLISAAMLWREQRNTKAMAAQSKRNMAESEAVLNFIVDDLLNAPANEKKSGREITVSEVLANAESKMAKSLAGQPNVEAWVRLVVASTYVKLGKFDKAEPLARRSLELRTSLLGPTNYDTLQSTNLMMTVLVKLGKYREARQLSQNALDATRDALGSHHPDTIESMNRVTWVMGASPKLEKSELDYALKLSDEALSLAEKFLGPEHPQTVRAEDCKAILLFDRGEYDQAEALWQKALETLKRVGGPDASGELTISENLASIRANRDHDQAGSAKALEEVLARARHEYGNKDYRLISPMLNLSESYSELGRWNEARKLSDEALAISIQSYGPDHATTIRCKESLADVVKQQTLTTIKPPVFAYRHDGKPEKANQLLEGAIAQSLAEGRYGPALILTGLTTTKQVNKIIDFAIADDPARVPSQSDVVAMWDLRLVANKSETALPTFRAAVNSEGSPAAFNNLGLAFLAQGKADEATAAFRSALAIHVHKVSAAHEEAATSASDLEAKEEILKRANDDQFNSAYFLDLITEKEYVGHFGPDRGYPWYYVGRRRELEHDQEAAVTAYTRCVEIGKVGTSVDNIPWTSALSRWRLSKIDPNTKQ